MPPRKRTHKGTDHTSARPYINWQVDFDYLDDLDPESRAWLERFSAEFYKNSTAKTMQDRPQLRERWRAYQANRRDITTRRGVDPLTADPGGLSRHVTADLDPIEYSEDAALERIAAREAEAAAADPLEGVWTFQD